MSLENLRSDTSWKIKPDVAPNAGPGWFDADHKRCLEKLMQGRQVVLELGSFLGRSTRFFAEQASTCVICVDHWQGSPEHQDRAEYKCYLSTLFETFQVNCWDLKDKIVALRMSTPEGMKEIVRHFVEPDFVYVDAGHDFDSVLRDCLLALSLFPHAIVAGDDYTSWPSVAAAVEWVGRHRQLGVSVDNDVWWFTSDRPRGGGEHCHSRFLPIRIGRWLSRRLYRVCGGTAEL